MKKILVLFATVVVMMMVTGCENPASIPANVHIPTQEEEWMRDGYRYCGSVGNDELAKKYLITLVFKDDDDLYHINSNGDCYVKSFETVANNLTYDEEYPYRYYILNNHWVKATNNNGVWDVKILQVGVGH